MNKTKVLVVLVHISIICSGQINFEKGYFINNNDEKTDCLIKNTDWLKNPSEFKYKLSENGGILVGDIKNVKEFGILNSSKYIRADVEIDTSSSLLKKLSKVKNPLWHRELVFLKVLVEGKATLYYYYGGNDKRFFYSSADTTIKQLIFKEYFYNEYQTAYNNTFRQQLLGEIKCPHTTVGSVTKINYNQKELEKYFGHYNSCVDTSYKVQKMKHNKGEFNLALSTGVSYSSLSISNDSKSYVNTDFGNKSTPLFSFEAEYVFPVNNYKWGLSFSPTFQSYKSEKQNDFGYVTVDLKSIDLAVGVRHYSFLNNKAKFFIDCYINSLLVYCPGSEIGFKVNTTKDLSYIDIERFQTNFIVGAGLEYKRVFAELRYYSNQNILIFHPGWDSTYKKISFSIGYKILKTKHNKTDG